MKRTDAQIFIVGHKPLDYGIWDNSLYTPIQVGNYTENIFSLRDNASENIAVWNPVFAESTAFYWIWKNVKNLDFVSVCQYRRRIELPEDFDFTHILEKGGAICTQPLRMNMTVRRQYEICHNAEDMEEVERIIQELFPEYSESWDRYINNGNALFYSNSFGMSTEYFSKYCELLFTAGFEFLRRKGIETPEQAQEFVKKEIESGKRHNTNGQGKPEDALRYQTQIMGFLSERLTTLFLRHYFENKLFLVPWKKFENV